MEPKETKIPGSDGFAFLVILLVRSFIALLFGQKRYEKGATIADISSTITPALDCVLAPAASAPLPPKETRTLAGAEYDSLDKLIRRLVAALFKSRIYYGFHSKKPTAIVKVSNVSLEATERDIKELFYDCGGIKSVEMQSDNEMSQIAHVKFKSIQGAEAAVRLSGSIVVDKLVTVTPAPVYLLVPSLAEIRHEESRLMDYLSILPSLDREAWEDFREELTHRLNEIESRKQIRKHVEIFKKINSSTQ